MQNFKSLDACWNSQLAYEQLVLKDMKMKVSNKNATIPFITTI